MKVPQILSLVVLGVSLGVATPVVSWLSYSLHNHRCCILVKKRHYETLFVSNVALLFGLAVVLPLSLLSSSGVLSKNEVMVTFSWFLQSAVFDAWTIATIKRYFLVMFDTRLCVFMGQDEWRAVINPHYQEISCHVSQWFFKHRNSIGNKKRINAVCAAYFVFLMAFCVVDMLYHKKYPILWISYFLFTFVFPLIAISVIYRLVPDFDDCLSIREEMRNHWRAFLLCFLFFGSLFVVMQKVHNVSDAWIYLIWNIDMLCVFSSFALGTSGWLLYKLHHEPRMHCNNHRNCKIIDKRLTPEVTLSALSVPTSSPLSTVPSTTSARTPSLDPTPVSDSKRMSSTLFFLLPSASTRSESLPRSGSASRPQRTRTSSRAGYPPLQLQTLMTHPEGFRSFMKHLNKEFSTENLLAYCEMLQYKFLFKFILRDRREFDTQIGENVAVNHRHVPVAEAIYNALDAGKSWNLLSRLEEFEDDLTICMAYNVGCDIFDKYVRTSSAYEVNISSRVRNELTHFFAAKLEETLLNCLEKDDWSTPWDLRLYTAFDACMRELRDLMTDSFSRFHYTPAYDKIRASTKLSFVARKT